MFYAIDSENNLISQKYSPDTPASKMELWADFSRKKGTTDGNISSDKYRKCPICGNAISPYLWGKDRVIKISNKRFPDFEFLWGDDLIVSQKFKDIYNQEHLTGIEAFETIEVYGKNQPPFKYYNCRISFSDIHWQFLRRNQKNQVKELTNCPKCGIFIDSTSGIIFDESTWDKHDIFQLYNAPHRYFVSDKMANIIKCNNLTNILLTPSDTCSW